MEAGDVELHPASHVVDTLHEHLLLRHDLSASVAGFPGARPAPHARNVIVRQAAIGELFPNHETEGRFLHDDASGRFKNSIRQIHRGATPGGVNPKAEVQARRILGRSPMSA
jgi:hypothetical protein